MMTNTNMSYEIGKGLVAEYIAQMETIYKEYKRLINIYENCSDADDVPELSDFNYCAALKFIRTWDIMNNNIPAHNRNLLFAIEASGQNYNKCLEYFNGNGKGYKNNATLHVLICKARKQVRKIYDKIYGDECNN